MGKQLNLNLNLDVFGNLVTKKQQSDSEPDSKPEENKWKVNIKGKVDLVNMKG